TFVGAAASRMALRKQADQPAANSCSGLVPPPEVPGDESLTSSRPSELREAPSRPPVVWAFAVYRTFSSWIMAVSFGDKRPPRGADAAEHAPLRARPPPHLA